MRLEAIFGSIPIRLHPRLSLLLFHFFTALNPPIKTDDNTVCEVFLLTKTDQKITFLVRIFSLALKRTLNKAFN